MRIYQTLITGMAIAFAPAGTAGAGGGDRSTAIAEIVTFEQAAGLDDADLIKAAHGTEDFVKSAPGFLSRHLSKGTDGRWTDYVLWADMDAALAAGQAAMQEPAFVPFMQAIAPDSVIMRHEPVHWALGD